MLAARTDPWLLIFDNVDQPADLDGLVPPAGPGNVLITSRNPNWPPTQRIHVSELALDPATAFLLTRTSAAGAAEQRAARQLAGKLGGLPLALEQAAAYVQTTGTSLRRYLQLYRTQRTQLHHLGSPSDYPETVATTPESHTGHYLARHLPKR